jgi:CRISPR system Cascade subunit CasD
MQQYLSFQLYGVLASWGEQAVGESRHSATHPSRSAILGLLAAALGIKREEEQALKRLTDSVSVGFKVIHHGLVLKDYHTIQVPSEDKKAKHRYTRRDELRSEKLGTVLSSREYRQDALSLAAVWLNEKSDYTLEELEHALKQPAFQLYLGRKSCPLSLPVNPGIIAADSFKVALDQYPLAPEKRHLGLENSAYYWEKSLHSGIENYSYRVPRYDQPLNRKHWQFSARDEYVLLPTGESHVSESR